MGSLYGQQAGENFFLQTEVDFVSENQKCRVLDGVQQQVRWIALTLFQEKCYCFQWVT